MALGGSLNIIRRGRKLCTLQLLTTNGFIVFLLYVIFQTRLSGEYNVNIKVHEGRASLQTSRSDGLSSRYGPGVAARPGPLPPGRWTTLNESMARRFEENFDRPWDKDLIEYIRARWIDLPPIDKDRHRQPSASCIGPKKDYSQIGQSSFVDKALGGREGGFYVESGAHDGCFTSNTLFFERHRKWTGLLVEPDPTAYGRLLNYKRDAFSANVCLSPSNKSQRLGFVPVGTLGGLAMKIKDFHLARLQQRKRHRLPAVTVQCFPIYWLMMAVGRTHIDYLSLDVEGSEIEILRTIPFGNLTIDVLTIEYRSVSGNTAETRNNLKEIRQLFETLDYEEIGILSDVRRGVDEFNGLDVVFKRRPSTLA